MTAQIKLNYTSSTNTKEYPWLPPTLWTPTQQPESCYVPSHLTICTLILSLSNTFPICTTHAPLAAKSIRSIYTYFDILGRSTLPPPHLQLLCIQIFFVREYHEQVRGHKHLFYCLKVFVVVYKLVVVLVNRHHGTSYDKVYCQTEQVRGTNILRLFVVAYTLVTLSLFTCSPVCYRNHSPVDTRDISLLTRIVEPCSTSSPCVP